ncbi:Chondroitin polymerase [Slackia heliotrinireducens]|uniref:Glycosyl transferase n=1 Tax=Slackia heliotrinireducens (strain ATCC 29202 / DSM 20476 / NCTC 11029 / RHS 1) TaxID=471855 RepID=C7N533_SLAHD|nr:glycosyltransferase [Slackia heliotrinireducens]ACV22018.1 glycosyl transferase [Slackia heliotrinireducens DSM 20476]VEG99939.1 Chondroitin polymerase [Slackia heliotrinireducens]
MPVSNPDISVIVPVRNAEQRLGRTLESVLAQTFYNFEIVVVDDASTDATPNVVAAFEAQDERVHAVRHEQPKSLGEACNTGVEYALAPYFLFWNAGDTFSQNALESLFARMSETQAEVCVCGVEELREGDDVPTPAAWYLKTRFVPAENAVFNRATNPERILDFTTTDVWNKAFSRELVEREGLRFAAADFDGDVPFTIAALSSAETVTCLPEVLICHMKEDGDRLAKRLPQTWRATVDAWVAAAKGLDERDMLLERQFAAKITGNLVYLLRNISDAETFAEAVSYIQNECLDSLHIGKAEDGDYTASWHSDFVAALRFGTPVDVMAYLQWRNYRQLEAANARQRVLAKDTTWKRNQDAKTITALEQRLHELEARNGQLEAAVEQLQSSVAYKAEHAIGSLFKKD